MEEEIFEFMCDAEDLFYTAREIADIFDISSQKASGNLRKLENRGDIASKKVKASYGEVKCYYTFYKQQLANNPL